MQCVTPMFRRYERGNHSKGMIVPRSEVMEELIYDENTIRNYLDKVNSYSRNKNGRYLYEQIPCGHCWACKLNYAAQWATRIMAECSEHEHNYFITFTYDDINIPIPEETEYNGKIFTNDGTWTGSLYPNDITRFINSLRRYFHRKGHTGIKYYYAGEYGETTQRPHYHMIIMNCPLDINEFYDFHQDPTTKKLHWKSHEIENFWQEGMIDIGEVEYASAAYVARYCMKKITENTDKTIYWSKGMHPEFVRMSRRPGIGITYYNENKYNIYENDEVIITSVKGNVNVIKPPKAFDQRFKEEHPEWWEKIQESRAVAAERSRQIEKELTEGISDLELYERKAQKLLKIQQLLPRTLEE